jgi:hypothetical protein
MWDTGFDLELGDEFAGFVEEGKCGVWQIYFPAKRYPTRGTYFRNRRFTRLISSRISNFQTCSNPTWGAHPPRRSFARVFETARKID